MEVRDVYDKYRNKTGRINQKGFKTKPDDYHLAVRLWVVNSKKEILIQRRQYHCKTWPGMWDCAAGGSAILGDNSRATTIRETKEEIGLYIEMDILEPLFSVKFRNGFNDNYLIRREVNIEELILEPEEVADVKWVTMDELNRMVINEEFIPLPFIKRVFEIINSDIRIEIATLDDKTQLLELQRTVFKPLLLKYEDHDFSPATQSMERFEKRFHFGDYFKIFYKANLVGSIFVFEKSPGIMRLHIMNILEEYQDKGIGQEVILRIESLYPQADKWELETILSENRNCHFYEKMGYTKTEETSQINDKLTLIYYIKDKDIYRIEDITDFKNK